MFLINKHLYKEPSCFGRNENLLYKYYYNNYLIKFPCEPPNINNLTINIWLLLLDCYDTLPICFSYKFVTKYILIINNETVIRCL